MPDVRTLIEEARTALLNGDPRRALGVAEHVLSRYPKHLEAYRLSAEALREIGELATGRGRFFRVLSADPEDLTAYWGLSIIHEEEGNLDAAIWGIDRALAVSPGHPDLAQEYVRLTGEQPMLGRAALARLRLRNGLYESAVHEAAMVLADDPDRLDIRLLQIEAFWRAGHVAEARTACLSLLEDAPDCLKANIILAHCLLRTEGAPTSAREEANRLLRRTLALDPEARLASQLFAGEPLPEALRAEVAELPSFVPPPSPTPSRPDEWLHEAIRLPEIDESPAPSVARSRPDDATDPFPIVTAGTEPPPREAKPTPVKAPDDAVKLDGSSPKRDVASWIGSPAGDLPLTANNANEPLDDPRWDALLKLDGALDPDSAGRLEEALAEIGSTASSLPHAPHRPPVSGDGWREIVPGLAGLRAALDELTASVEKHRASLRDSGRVDRPKKAEPPLERADRLHWADESATDDEREPVSPVGIPHVRADSSPAAKAISHHSARVEAPSTERNSYHRGAVVSSRPNGDAPPRVRSHRQPTGKTPALAHDSGAIAPPTRQTSTSEFEQSTPAELPRELPRPAPLLRPSPSASPTTADFRARLSAAHARQQRGELDEAVAEYASLLRVAPELMDEIIEYLKWLLYTTPDHAAAHRALGDAYMRCGRYQDAIDEYNWVLSQRRNTPAPGPVRGSDQR